MAKNNFIDFFSGVGGFTRGLQLAGHECIGHCEFDKYAEASYRSMHCITEKERQELLNLSLKKRQKEILNKKYLRGEFYKNDIREIKGEQLPNAGIWTFGAPCQDFSIAGNRQGLGGNRSSLIREIFRLLEERKEKDRPEWLIYENVKGMLSSNRGLDFLSIIAEMDRLGYDCEWQVINSRWWIPQNRERVYTIGHLRRKGRRQIFPITGTGGENCLKQPILGSQGNRVYDKDGISCTLAGEAGGLGAKTGLYAFGIDKSCNFPKQIDITNCLTARENRAVSNRKAEGTAVAIPVLTPDRANKRQNGRRFKKAGEPSFTLTTQDVHGVAIKAREATKDGFATNQGILVKIKESNSPVWAMWSEKYNCYLAIRKLTPRECFRLQGWTDNYFEKAEQFNSNSQLYKQAGNGVTVNIIKEIGESL